MSIRNWLKNTDSKNREVFVDCIFELLYSSDIDTFRELSKVWISKVPKMLSTYKSLSKEEKSVIGDMIKEFLKGFSLAMKEFSKEKIEELEKNLFD